MRLTGPRLVILAQPTAPFSNGARSNGCIVFTHDLDFGAILAATQASGPSVIQIRAENVLPEGAGDAVIAAIRRFQDGLERGALISVDPARARARILPLEG